MKYKERVLRDPFVDVWIEVYTYCNTKQVGDYAYMISSSMYART